MELHENHSISHLKIKKLKDSLFIVIGQSSLPILSRLGSHMYWNNTWVSFFNRKNFFNKTVFFENIYLYLFSENLFNFFFAKNFTNLNRVNYFKNFLIRKKALNVLLTTTKSKKLRKIVKKKTKYNLSRVWFVKYNNFILFTTFVFFYFKIKKKKTPYNKLSFKKKPSVFWRKKKNSNLKKKKFSNLEVFQF